MWLECMLIVGHRIVLCLLFFFFFKQKTAYEMRISDWSSECALPICSTCLADANGGRSAAAAAIPGRGKISRRMVDRPQPPLWLGRPGGRARQDRARHSRPSCRRLDDPSVA